MTELLSTEKVTMIGLLLCAVAYLFRNNNEYIKKLSEQHSKEEERILSEMKEMKDERKQERKEWLNALSDNTRELGNIAKKLEAVPNIQKDLDTLKKDVAELRGCNGGRKNT